MTRTILLTVLAVGHLCAATPKRLPELAELKLAAERGDAVAQYDYSRRIALSNATESFAMALRSAKQGYGPAELSVGNHYLSQAPLKGKDRLAFERVGVRYVSRAAFKGLHEAQAVLSRCYQRGIAVPKDSVVAYGWLAVALKGAGGPQAFSGMSYRSQLNTLIANTSSADIAKGEAFAAKFRVGMPNFVEVDLIIRQLKLTALYTMNGQRLAQVNQTRIAEGTTMKINIDGEEQEITCTRIEGRVAHFKTGPYEFTLNAP